MERFLKKREAVRWIKARVAAEIRGRIANEMPDAAVDELNDAKDVELVESLWLGVVLAGADRFER